MDVCGGAEPKDLPSLIKGKGEGEGVSRIGAFSAVHSRMTCCNVPLLVWQNGHSSEYWCGYILCSSVGWARDPTCMPRIIVWSLRVRE